MKLARLLAIALVITSAAGVNAQVISRRAPGNGLQPKAVKSDKGTVHLLYFAGDPAHGDLFYCRSSDDGESFANSLRVNTTAGSAIAVGTIRGGQLAIGAKNRPHVAWMGSDRAQPRAANNAAPMLYTRLADDGKSFEPERNVITSAVGLDGGGGIATDQEGRVYVGWHAPTPGTKGEANRRVWVATSEDDGRTFDAEQALSQYGNGACGCCGLRMLAEHWFGCCALYRTATDKVHRDMHMIAVDGPARSDKKLDPWEVDYCVMSTSDMLMTRDARMFAAWETKGEIFVTQIASASGFRTSPAAGNGKRKHPALAYSNKDELLVAWTEGTGWQRGGSVHYQRFDKDLKPIGEPTKIADDLPAWSSPSAFAREDGSFVIYY